MAGSEAATLLGFLDFQRATLAWKCDGVDAAGLQVTVGVSPMTLGGLLKHLAYVEDDWFSRWLAGHDQAPWDAVDWGADPDWDWTPVPSADGIAFQTAPFTVPTTIAGPATLELWVKAAAPVEDFQATITEVRPQTGQEEYVTSGFLRSSDRALSAR